MENGEFGSTSEPSLDKLVEVKKQEAINKGVYEEAYRVAEKYGKCAGGHTRLYEEREPNGKFLGLIPRTKRIFAVEYDEIRDGFCGIYYRHMRIYEGNKLVFRADAHNSAITSTSWGWSKPKIGRYISSGNWEKHLKDIDLNGPKTLQEELRNNFNL